MLHIKPVLLLISQVAAENESLREELEEKKEELDQVRQKLLATEKEVKASSLMNLELADYERSVETLRGQLKEKEIQQVDLEKEISSWERKCEDLNNELGKVNFVMFSRCVALLPLSLPPSLSHCPCPNTIYIHN